jgi:hypothetical protein
MRSCASCSAAGVVAQRSALLVVAQVADRVGGANQRHRSGEQNHQRAERVGIEEAVCQRDRAAASTCAGQRDGGQKDDAEAGQVRRFHGRAPAREERRGGGGNGDQQ